MRKTFLIALVLLSGFLLASLGLPQTQYAPKTTAHTLHTATVADTLTWKLLGQIKYVKKPSDDYPEGVMYPVVNTSLKGKQGKTIVMSGFIIPIDNKSYALSKNVFASCFFCGQAGPETIMGIKFKNNGTKLKTDQYVTLTGTFRYNDNDVDDWIYHIENAVVVSK
ncbi:hypothetical protein AM493_10650 [Flavobacterium akiainvivens]|uniref:DUF3299 domain-containing protein n=1 Tax=Flavobacterium akiainvivens TaxID=1202724 RepID=A0A0M9VIB9_9FLAO|nr:hypothetical protein [Flavobacterium akiainvivens]KOS06442.1 hypothetical protein AM493_10650 [Flavobacterium akiainvivens]SFQ13456.1 hypothetical protein SAMN05444144_101232 [Flavobacterium akiainvivens]